MPKKPPHQIVQLLASISTILALVIMLVERVANHSTFPPQQEAWRWIFVLVAAVCIAGAFLYLISFWHQLLRGSPLWPGKQILKAVVVTVVGLLLLGVAVDALLAAIYWSPFMYALPKTLREYFQAMGELLTK